MYDAGGYGLRAQNSRKAVMIGLEQKLALYGFNNLTKTLSFNIYDVCYAKTEREQTDYIAYIDEQYNSERLTKILCRVTEMIGAKILNISKQDYYPQGASVNILIAEKALTGVGVDPSCNQGTPVLENLGLAPHAIEGDTVHAHLDKSHVTVHTFPEHHPDNSVSTFRVDIDVVHLRDDFAAFGAGFPDRVVRLGYHHDRLPRPGLHPGRPRQKATSSTTISPRSRTLSTPVPSPATTRSTSTSISPTSSTPSCSSRISSCRTTCFNQDVYELPPAKRLEITDLLRREMIEIYSGMNIYG